MRIAISFLLLCSTLFGEDFAFIIPPKSWELADPEKLSGRVKVAFFKTSSKELPALINLATEEVDISLKDYVAAVRKVIESDPSCRWRDLGKFQTNTGEARLTEIETLSECGPVRQLQLLSVKNKMAYVVTASALKEEFSKYYQDFQSAFRSMTITSDLISTLPHAEKRESLRKLKKQLKEKKDWIAFQNILISEYTELGPYWQALMLQSTHEEFDKESL